MEDVLAKQLLSLQDALSFHTQLLTMIRSQQQSPRIFSRQQSPRSFPYDLEDKECRNGGSILAAPVSSSATQEVSSSSLGSGGHSDLMQPLLPPDHAELPLALTVEAVARPLSLNGGADAVDDKPGEVQPQSASKEKTKKQAAEKLFPPVGRAEVQRR
jgi:hypothetical protein